MSEVHNNPNLRTDSTTQKIMLDVCIALMPALAASVFFFGINSLILTAVSAVTCVAAEGIWQLIRHEPLSVSDFSAVVTGILLAFNMSSATPVWAVMIADVFAIIVVKQIFGGLGNNVVNPALMGRLFMMLVYPAQIMNYVLPSGVDAVSTATVLSGGASNYSVWNMILGRIPGALGETSALLLLAGFLYLVLKKEVNAAASVVYIVIVGVCSGILNGGDFASAFFGGGLFLGGLFMLTDYVFVSRKGNLIYAVTAAVITVLIRQFSGYPEGVCFGILITNCLVYFLDLIGSKPHVYGISD